MQESSVELLERARTGDRGALEALIEAHQARVYRFGMQMCRDPDDASDVVQDTLMAMARGIRDFRGASSLSTWLFTIARSFCIKKRRRSKHAGAEERSLEGDASRLADPALDPEAALAGKQIEQALTEAIAALEPMYREVLVLRDVEGLSAREVAEVVGASVAAVKSRLHRARLAVRERVAPLLGISAEAEAEAVTAPSAGACPDVLQILSQHLEGDVGPEVCAEMEEHVAACGRCRGACDSLRRSLALCRSVGPSAQVPEPVRRDIERALREVLASQS